MFIYFFLKKNVIYFHNLAKRDFFAKFIFAVGSCQKKFTEFIFVFEFNFATSGENGKNKVCKNIFHKNLLRKNFFP